MSQTKASVTHLDKTINMDITSSVIHETRDLLAVYSWAIDAGLMKDDDTILSGYNFDISPLISVKEGMIIKLDYGFHSFDNQAIFPDIIQFDNNSLLTGTLLLNASYDYANDYDKVDKYKYVTIPADVSFIKICGKFSLCEVKGYLSSLEDDMFTSHNNPELNNLLVAGKLGSSSDGTTTTSFLNSSVATGFVPVSVGQTIRYNMYSIGDIYAVNLFDINKLPLRTLHDYTVRGEEHEYTFNILDDSDVAYFVACSYQPDGSEYLYLSGTSTKLSEIVEDISNVAKSTLFNKSDVSLSAFQTTATILDKSTIQVNADTAYVYIEPSRTQNKTLGLDRLCTITTFKLISGVSPIGVEWYIPSGAVVSDPITNINIGDEFTVYASSHTQLLITSANTSIISIVKSVGFYLKNSYTDKEILAVLSNKNILDKSFSVASLSMNASRADSLKTELDGKSIVFFGDSVTAAFSQAQDTSDEFNMTLTNLAVSGSTPYATSNLSDVQLALIPADAYVIIITGGTNAYSDTPSGDLASRDRATMEGTINFAIDYIYANIPKANIVLGTVQNRDSTLSKCTWSQMYRDLGLYRGIPVIDIETDCGINSGNQTQYLYDGVHPNTDGIFRLARTWIAGLRRIFS